MTLDELLDKSADELEKMTDQELVTFFSPYFNVTRPELAPKPNKSFQPVKQEDFLMKQKLAQLREIGLDFSGLLAGRKKK